MKIVFLGLVLVATLHAIWRLAVRQRAFRAARTEILGRLDSRKLNLISLEREPNGFIDCDSIRTAVMTNFATYSVTAREPDGKLVRLGFDVASSSMSGRLVAVDETDAVSSSE